MAVLLISLTLKASSVLAAAWLLTRVMSRNSAASRHLVWTLAVVAVLTLPAMQIAGPRWDLPVLPAAADDFGLKPEATASLSPDATADDFRLKPEATANLSPDATADMWLPPSGGSLDSDGVAVPSAPAHESPSGTPVRRIDWRIVLGLVWLAGMTFALLRIVAGLIWVGRVTRRAVIITDEDWQAALYETTSALRVSGDVSLKMSVDTTIPVACGVWQPTVLLPADADSWSPERRRVVLLHEMAHVARRDCLVQTIAQLARAVYWFNPLAHVAVARLRAEQERACDDLVLAAGTDAPLYADHLFEIARTFRAGGCPAWATLAMARPSQLEGRVVAILDDRRNRRPPARWVRAAVSVAAAALTLPIGVLQLTAAARPAGSPVAKTMTAGERVAASMAIEESDAAAPAAPAEWRESTVVSAAAQLVDVIDDFDFDFDWYGPVPARVMEIFGDFDSDADSQDRPDAPDAPDASDWLPMGAFGFGPDPNPNPKPRVSLGATSRSQSQSQSQSRSQSNSQSQSPSQNTTVTDETRRRVADALITALNDENEDVREQALQALAGMRDARAIPGLLRALRDSSADVREQAVNGLAQFDTPEALDGLLSALKDQSPDVREHAARHVAALGSRGRLNDAKYVEIVSALLKDAAPDVREAGIVALGRMRRQESVPLLLPMLKDMSADVREQAAVALGFIADPRAIDALTAALKDAQPDVREQAAIALGRIARGQRRGTPGIPSTPPVPPVPPVPPPPPPRGVQLDLDEINEIAQRAQEAAQRALEEFQRQQEDFPQRQEDLQRRLR